MAARACIGAVHNGFLWVVVVVPFVRVRVRDEQLRIQGTRSADRAAQLSQTDAEGVPRLSIEAAFFGRSSQESCPAPGGTGANRPTPTQA